jgi:hypothetical protein
MVGEALACAPHPLRECITDKFFLSRGEEVRKMGEEPGSNIL